MVFGFPQFHLKFKDRASAGKFLATAIKDTIKNTKLLHDKHVTILGIPRGGTILADRIATEMSNSYFDIIIPRKLRAPDNEEIAIGAIMLDGTTYLDQKVLNALSVKDEYLAKEKQLQIEEIRRRQSTYFGTQHRKDEPKLDYHNKIKDKVVVLVDDGAASGSTVIVAARWIRKQQPDTLIIAVPVAPKDTEELFKNEADIVEVITTVSSAKFRSVSQFYQSFDPVTDDAVVDILKKRLAMEKQ